MNEEEKLISGTFWCVTGKCDDGDDVVLLNYARPLERQVLELVKFGMLKEGFDGTVEDRLKYLGWRVKQFCFDEIPF